MALNDPTATPATGSPSRLGQRSALDKQCGRAGFASLGSLLLVLGLIALSFAGGAFASSAPGEGYGGLLIPTQDQACSAEALKVSNGQMRLNCKVADQDLCQTDDGEDGKCDPSTTLAVALPGQSGGATFKYCACEGAAQGNCCQVVIKEINGNSIGPVPQGSCLSALGCSGQSNGMCLLSYSKQPDPPFNEVWKATCLGKF